MLPSPPCGYVDRMPRFAEATVLRPVERGTIRSGVQLAPEAAEAWNTMHAAAEADGAPLLLLSGFRSISRQEEIVRGKLAAGQTWDEILAVSAYPGFSEHHTGRAIDVGAAGCPPLTEAFEQTRQFEWLCTHGRPFGFALSYPRGNCYGIAYEPWHWYFAGLG